MLSAQDDEISYLRDKVFELEGQLASSKLETKIVEKVAVKKPKKVK
jgi:hypothetical protein